MYVFIRKHALFSTISLQGRETEHNWAAREQSIIQVRGMLKGDVHQRFPDVFLASLKDGFLQLTLKTVSKTQSYCIDV